jgi:carboxylesterase
MQGGAPFLLPGGKTGCLLVHGFTASPQEMRYLGERLSEHGFTVLGIRLFGHATNVGDLNRARWWDWIASLEDGIHILRGMCDKVALAGLSLGGALSLTSSASEQIDAVVAMATPFRLPPDLRLRWLKPILRPLSIFMPTYHKGIPDWNDPTLLEERVDYSEYAVRAVEEVRKLLSIMRSKVEDITAPVLLIHSRRDVMVPATDMDEIFQRLRTDKHREWVDQGGHNIVCDADRHAVADLTADFIAQATS